MKKLIFFVAILLVHETRSSLQANLEELYDNLVALEHVLSNKKFKTQEVREQEFVALLQNTKAVIKEQSDTFDDFINFLNSIDDTTKLLKIKNYKKNFEHTSDTIRVRLAELIEKVSHGVNDPDIKAKFNKEVLEIYKNIQNDWNIFYKSLGDFITKNEHSPFFIKESETQDAELIGLFGSDILTIKKLLTKLKNSIEDINKETQLVLDEYIKIWKA